MYSKCHNYALLLLVCSLLVGFTHDLLKENFKSNGFPVTLLTITASAHDTLDINYVKP